MPSKQQSFFETYLTGDAALDARLQALDVNTRKKYTRRAVGKGGTLLVRAIKRAAPVGKTRNLKKAIGRSLKKVKEGNDKFFQGLRVGMNVGKKAARQAPHGHLVVLGTRKRMTKKGKSTGRMPKNDFIKPVVRSQWPKVKSKIASELAKDIFGEASQ